MALSQTYDVAVVGAGVVGLAHAYAAARLGKTVIVLERDIRANGASIRKRIRIGSGTGYTRTMMAAVLPRAAAQGYAPDVVVRAGETPAGRPSPLMVWKALVELGVWPARACIKVDDAEVGIEEGRTAGCWTVGVAASGNGVGLSLAEFEALSDVDREARVVIAARSLHAADADFVVETVADLGLVVDEIGRRITNGERPPIS